MKEFSGIFDRNFEKKILKIYCLYFEEIRKILEKFKENLKIF